MSLASNQTGDTVNTVHAGNQKNATNQGTNAMPARKHDKLINNRAFNRGSNQLGFLSGGLSLPREIVVEARKAYDNSNVFISLSYIASIGNGTFGEIERASLTVSSETPEDASSTGEHENSKSKSRPLQVAVKRVLQDPRYKNRELNIMQKLGNHPNIVQFYYYYYSTCKASKSRSSKDDPLGTKAGDKSGDSEMYVYLHLVLECFPESLCDLIYRYSQNKTHTPALTVKVFTYQMLKALAYLHSHSICHRDIKSSNLLVNESSLVLKVCDFGSAKEMSPGSPNVSYISSRYYRAPELLFGAQSYTCAIDTWSAGCVLAEMLRQGCLFTGNDSVDQLVRVIKVLGTPSAQDIASMNPLYDTYNFPNVQSCPVQIFFPRSTPSDLLALMNQMLVYNPTKRISAHDTLSHHCFDELREIGPDGVLGPNATPMPPHIFEKNPPANTSLSSSHKKNQQSSKEEVSKKDNEIKREHMAVDSISEQAGKGDSGKTIVNRDASNVNTIPSDSSKQAGVSNNGKTPSQPAPPSSATEGA